MWEEQQLLYQKVLESYLFHLITVILSQPQFTHLSNVKYLQFIEMLLGLKEERYIECLAHSRHSVVIVTIILLNN